MGTSTISEVGKMFATVQPAGGNSSSGDDERKLAFAEVMSQMSAMADNGMQGQQDFPHTKTDLSSDAADRAYDRSSYREVELQGRGEKRLADDSRISEKVERFSEDVRDVLKEELGVTDEQIEAAMESLGIGFADLLDPKQLASLVAELTGTQDTATLLCSGEFLDIMQAVGTLGEDLLKELGMNAQELQDMLDAAVQNVADAADVPVRVTEETAEVRETDADAAVYRETEQVTDAAPKQVAEDAYRQTDRTAETSEEQVVVETASATEKEETAFSGSQNPARQNAANGGAEHAMTGQQTVTEMAEVQAAAETEFASPVDTTDIIRQIVEFARVSTGNAATTMEMQLNPEHLGKVFLELSSRNGIVSAHLTVQNEAAREALESQLVELRQNLTQTGVKVEAVEVTVGSHEFERNLEQNAKRDEQQGEEQERAAKQTRQINLNELDELGGLMTEEESLVAQMMAEQGNSVDFTA